jgi:hypothetical protein
MLKINIYIYNYPDFIKLFILLFFIFYDICDFFIFIIYLSLYIILFYKKILFLLLYDNKLKINMDKFTVLGRMKFDFRSTSKPCKKYRYKTNAYFTGRTKFKNSLNLFFNLFFILCLILCTFF